MHTGAIGVIDGDHGRLATEWNGGNDVYLRGQIWEAVLGYVADAFLGAGMR